MSGNRQCGPTPQPGASAAVLERGSWVLPTGYCKSLTRGDLFLTAQAMHPEILSVDRHCSVRELCAMVCDRSPPTTLHSGAVTGALRTLLATEACAVCSHSARPGGFHARCHEHRPCALPLALRAPDGPRLRAGEACVPHHTCMPHHIVDSGSPAFAAGLQAQCTTTEHRLATFPAKRTPMHTRRAHTVLCAATACVQKAIGARRPGMRPLTPLLRQQHSAAAGGRRREVML